MKIENFDVKSVVRCLCFFFLTPFLGLQSAYAQFTIADEDQVTSIVYDGKNTSLDSISAYLLAQDIEAVTKKRPKVYTKLEGLEGNVIVIGDVNSTLISTYIDTSRLSDQWELYERIFLKSPIKGIDQAMFIAGSDPRGTAYGVFDLSAQIGVSPWYWWADAPINQKDDLWVKSENLFSNAPSVKHRGIFINDEGWGLEPWASKTFEPEVGNLGPKTYAKIFELLLRLKGNVIWPGMHPNTRPFFTVPGNREVADKWEIVVGTSHAEPMLRNNVGEWDGQTMGSFNYQSNAASVYNYWENRVKQSVGVDAIYTVGMRGVHDSGMQGFSSMDEKVLGLQGIIADQRGLLSKYINDDISEVSQSFSPYKEVLDIYESGMEVPQDITIIWPDDNHGHIKRFSTQGEQQRSGGTGIYYHISYLGAPHPYIWLSPMNPSLIWREMTRASLKNMNEIWVVNVGDLKRREWGLEFFMDLAWNVDAWNQENIKDYFTTVASRDISPAHGQQIADVMWEYYRLSTERKPEFMGFNAPQWNGWPPINDPLFSLWHYNDEVASRMYDVNELKDEAQRIMSEIPDDAVDTYYQLVYYPIAGAAAMNDKWLYAYKSREYAQQGRAVANAMSDSAFAAFDEIKDLTFHYNHEIADGKWEHIVDYSPSYKKGSLVFWEPITQRIQTEALTGLGVAIEGQSEPLKPIGEGLPDIVTRESVIKIDVSKAKLSGEMTLDVDSDGEFLTWPWDGTNKQIDEPRYDVIPYEIGNATKAVFEFHLEDTPGGVHTLYLSVDHPDNESDSWWITMNDKPAVRINDSVGRIQQLKGSDFVLKQGLNKLVIHPGEDGAKLYGIELIQKSERILPKYTDQHKLPVFEGFPAQRHFIDIYNRGHQAEKWSATTSEPWIELSSDSGELHGQQDRLWVSINYNKANQVKELKGYVEITNGQQDYRIDVSAINKEPYQKEGFTQNNGIISIPAYQFNYKNEGEMASWQPLGGLGRSGSAMLLQPMSGWYLEDLSEIREKAPSLEYDLIVTKGGKAEVIVEAVPSFSLEPSQQLRCAISMDDGMPKWVNFEMEGQHWDDNVLEGRMSGTTQVDLKPGTYRMKVWGTDPSVNIDRILIDFGGLKESYNGPKSTQILVE